MNKRAKLTMASAMTIFGTVGIFRRYIPLSSSLVSFVRGLIGTLILILFVLLSKKKLSKEAVKSNLIKLLVSGALIGLNWVCLFESYNYTTVATATLCYYMAPIFVMIASFFIFKNKVTVKKIVTICVALLGMMLVSGILSDGTGGKEGIKGIIYGLFAALMYATVIIINKKMSPIDAYSKTIVQLGAATVVLFPYLLFTKAFTGITLNATTLLLLLCVGILHTGIAYAMYFGSMDGLSADSIALFSYIDPVVAIILSALLLKEPMGLLKIIGAVLILGATAFNELTSEKG